MRFVTLLLALVLPQILAAQVLTQQQCEQSIRGRASLSISTSEAADLCEKYPYEVIECAIDQFSTHPLSGNFKQSLKRCRVEFSGVIKNN